MLTGKVTLDRVFAEGDERNDDPQFLPSSRKKVLRFLDEIKAIANEYRLTLGQLVSAWTISQPGCTHVLLGARNVSQVLENLKGGEVEIDGESLRKISEVLSTNFP